MSKKKPKTLFWPSFAGDEGFRGAIIAEARSVAEAIEECERRGIHPGGEVFAVDAPDDGGYGLWTLITLEMMGEDAVNVTDDVLDMAANAGASPTVGPE